MGFLHRLFGRKARQVWQAETRLMHRLGCVHPPEAVQWISTSVCDLTCPHCYSHAGKKLQGELSTDEARRLIIDELVRLDRPLLVIAGGEAMLRKDFADVVAYCHRQGVPWGMHTHGGRVEQMREVLLAHPPAMTSVSLDGPRDYHDRFRGKAGAFDAALRAVQVLKEVGCPEVVLGTTINRDNADLVADLLPTVLASGADSWGFHLVTPEGRAGQHPELLPTRNQLRRLAAFARRMRSLFHVELDNEWGSAGDDDCFYRDDPFLCGAGRVSCVVAATGEVMPCTTTDPGESQGNIRDLPLSQIWAQGFAAFRSGEDPVKGDCNDCWLNTRHGHSCRSAFLIDLFEDEPAERETGRQPLDLIAPGGQS